MKPIISVEGLGKSYVIRHEGQTRYKSLREEIFQLPKQLLQRNRQSQEEFWALKDVNFDVMPGDRVGIIGRNGAGKSTLLKLLSRITEPTTGRITLRGRVASLLEVGTGFHPELTGRENIFLNGAILGMSRAEVRRKFDEIVDFAGVEKFLDTPVKRYSSGMYVRLAFAVAAHLEPEILIVDEVLAVGDAEFQKKCLGKMEDVGKEGRTVLFVSHNIGATASLCNYGFFLSDGTIKDSGPIDKVIRSYAFDKKLHGSNIKNMPRKGNGAARLKTISFYSVKDNVRCAAATGSNVHIVLEYGEINESLLHEMDVDIRMMDSRQQSVLWASSTLFPHSSRRGDFHFVFPKFPLVAGVYSLNFFAHQGSEIIDWVQEYHVTVESGIYYKSGVLPSPQQTSTCCDFYMENLDA